MSRGALVALIAVGLAAGCGGSPARPAAARAFIDLVPALPRSLDPAQEQGGDFAALEGSLAGTLVRPAARPPGSATLAAPSAVTAFLALSWHAVAGGDYVFALRSGVRSPFGHALSGADVRFSFARELARSAAARALAHLARIRLADPVTVLAGDRVRVNVTGPSRFTLPVLANVRFGVLDARAVAAHESAGDPDAHAWLSDHLAFFGAYRLARLVAGRTLLLHANPGFWRPLAFTDVAVEAVPSSSLRLGDVGAAEASHTSGLTPADFAVAARTTGLRTQTLATGALSVLVPDERFAPFAHAAVRRALSLVIARAALARAGFGPLATAALHPVSAAFATVPGVRLPTFAHDPALARTLLAAAGYPHGFAMTLAAGPGANAAELSALMGQLRAVGVRATLAHGGRPSAVVETVVPAVASAAFAIDSQEVSGAPLAALAGYRSPALDALGRSLDGASAAGALRRALAILAASMPVIPLAEVRGELVTRASIGGYAAVAGGAVHYDELRG